MEEMTAAKFRAKCLAVMDRVQRTGEPVLITRHGKPVVKLVPAETVPDEVFGYVAGKVKVLEDIVGSVTPLEDWEHK